MRKNNVRKPACSTGRMSLPPAFFCFVFYLCSFFSARQAAAGNVGSSTTNRNSDAQEAIGLITASDDEIKDLITELRTEDTNRLAVRTNWQGHVYSTGRTDASPAKLFSAIDAADLGRDSYQRLRSLYDKFNQQTGQRENVTSDELAAIDAFLEFVYETNVMKKTLKFLKAKGLAEAATKQRFIQKLKTLWFDQYSRAKGQLDTSAFEHVFVGELKNNEVQGMHNWYRVYELERDGSLDYKGYIIKRGAIFGMVQFEWLNTWKPSGSFLIGTSPEFDLSVYTLCFLAKPGYKKCKLHLENTELRITSHPLHQNGKTFIGSIYPSTP